MKSLNCRLLFAFLLLFITMATSASAFAQITPSQDSYTNTATATTNYGAAAALGVVSSTTSIQTTYIKFDLSSIPTGYTSANVAKATLKLYVNSVAQAGSFNVDFINGSWAERTITADLAPPLGNTIASSVPLVAANANDYVLIDVTSAVGDWLNGSLLNDGIALVANSGLSATFDSKENSTQSHPAELDIVFTSGGTITGVKTANGSGLTGGGNSGTLNLSLTKTCSSKQVLQWNGSAWVCASGGTGTISGVTAGTGLTGGGGSGDVTLNLDTTKVPMLNAANSFAGNQTINGTVTATAFSGDGTNVTKVNAAQLGGHAASYFANTSNNAFTGPQIFQGNGNSATIGDMGCGSGFVGMTLFGGVNCQTYSILGDTVGNLYLNRPTNGTMHFREGNADEMIIAPGGLVGIGMVNPAGQLEVNAAASGYDALIVLGYSAPFGSLQSGNEGISVFGGDGDFQDSLSSGNNGVSANGGNGGGYDGIGGLFTGGGPGSVNGGGDGIEAYAGSGLAGVFTGDISVSGAISAGTKDFKIDHPLDPANKYLVHASVESSEMKNIYDGVVVTDAQGEAMVSLPEWFEALNTDFRYQLTVIGQFAQAIVGNEIENRQFQIKTNAPNVKVSWQVTGVRRDAFAKAHPLVVEQEKEARLKGFYIHPELYGAAAEKQIEWGRHPEMMKQMKEKRVKPASVRKP